MPRTRTLLQLREEALETADLEDSTIVSDAELTRQVNESIAWLHDELIDVEGPHYARVLATATASASSSTAALPDDFYKLYGVDVQLTRWEPAAPLDWARRNDLQEAPGWTAGRVFYDVGGADLLFWPAPAQDTTVRIWYVPYATELSADGDTFDGINGWERFVVLDVAVWCRNKNEGEVAELAKERAQQLDRIIRMAKRRDRGSSKRPRDVRGQSVSTRERWERGTWED